MGKRDLVALLNLSSWCLVMVERLFLAVPRGCLRFVIVVFPDHTHYYFCIFKKNDYSKVYPNSYLLAFFYKQVSRPTTRKCHNHRLPKGGPPQGTHRNLHTKKDTIKMKYRPFLPHEMVANLEQTLSSTLQYKYQTSNGSSNKQ